MRELHVVAVSEDGRHVLLGPSKTKPTHRVRLDARLVSAVRGDLGRTGEDLSPKEIQARLRAGESAEQIARSAGMAVTRVERFAGPVAAEMARVVDEARAASVVRGRLGPSEVPLGTAVDAALAAAGDSVVWSARREDDGRWYVQVAWAARGRQRTAAWRYEPQARGLEPVDGASATLGHVPAPGAAPRPTRSVKPAPRPTPKPTAKPTAKAPKPTPTSTAKPTAKAAPRPTAKAAPKPVAKRPAGKPAAAKAPAPKPAGKPRTGGRPRLQVVPDPAPAARTRRTKAAAREDARDGVRSRASVPAWADVLLGTTPGGDQG